MEPDKHMDCLLPMILIMKFADEQNPDDKSRHLHSIVLGVRGLNRGLVVGGLQNNNDNDDDDNDDVFFNDDDQKPQLSSTICNGYKYMQLCTPYRQIPGGELK